jgi:1-acyl-sn-glycerol-3-phosphate acyltransferase
MEWSFGLEVASGDLDRFLVVNDLIRYVETGFSEVVDDSAIVVPSWHQILNAPLTAEEAQQEQSVFAPRPILRPIILPALWLLLSLTRLLFRVHGSGSRELPTQAFAFCSNHNSHLDPLFLACALPASITRRLVFLGFAEYFASGRFLWLWHTLRVAPIDPDRYARSGLRLTIAGIRRNFVPCYFPEGSRSASGGLQPFLGGLGLIMRENGIPVVPVAIIGSYDVLARGSRRIRFVPVEVRFGEVMMPSPTADLTPELYAAVDKLLSNAS